MKKTDIFPILRAGTRGANARLGRIRSRNVVLDNEILSRVSKIIDTVRSDGDSALFRYTEEFDGVRLTSLRVDKREIEKAVAGAGKKILAILEESAENIRKFHERQRRNSWTVHGNDGTILGQRIIPLERVGLYVPGGTASYPSTVLMNAIPAQVAGVKEISVATPPGRNGHVNRVVLAACGILGIESIYSVGGAQGIAALAYGTSSVSKVDKIVGPGNVFVAAAKKIVFGDVDIDMIAGPSEVVVLTDSTAIPAEVAADLLAQAEHDRNAAAVLITTDAGLAVEVRKEILRLLRGLSRRDIASESMRGNGGAFVSGDMDAAVALVNEIAPEHLEIVADGQWEILGRIKNAGAVFIGRYSPEPVGDYFAGPSHVLPTGGTARFSSVLNVESFVKRSSIIHYSKNAFERDAGKIATFAEGEGLTAHALSIKIREKGGRKRKF